MCSPTESSGSADYRYTESKGCRLRFLEKQIVTDSTTAEYGGFNTKMSREQGHTFRPATKTVHAPLIDMVPHDSDTIMTATVEAQRPTKQSGQTITLFTNDQQLYRVAVNVM